MPDITTRANVNPTPVPTPKNTLSRKLYSLNEAKSASPKTAQLVVIERKIYAEAPVKRRAGFFDEHLDKLH